jgi:hypothetical protein
MDANANEANAGAEPAPDLVLFQALMTALTSANASLQQIAARLAPPVVPPAPPVPFHRTPLSATGTANVINYTEKDKQKLFKEATKSLFDTGSKFGVEPGDFQTFINLLHIRARDLGMLEPGGNMLVPIDPANPHVGTPINSILDYGRTTLEQVTNWERTFIALDTRASQDSKMMFEILSNSLSTTGLKRIQVWKNQYSINGLDSGGCMLKVIIRESYLDSNATVSTLKMNLANLDDYIRDNGSDLVAFNAYVQSQLDGLAARGETTSDLMVYLFKAYKVIADPPFKMYITNIKDSHDDGTKVFSAHELMQKAVTFYKKSIQEKEWEQPSEDRKEVLALKAELKAMKKQNDKNEKHVTFANNTKKAGGSKKGTKKKGSNRPDWLLNNTPPPDPKAMKFRFWNDLKWYWCAPVTGGKCKGNWRRHAPSECKGIAQKEASSEKKPAAVGTKRKAKAMKIVTANSTLTENAEAEQEGEEVYEKDEYGYDEDSDYEN